MTLPYSIIGITLYQLKHGVKLRNSWDWKSPGPATPREKLNIKEAIALASRMHKV
jgi:hypothetical protein